MPLTASGLLITKEGVGRFQLESAEISGVTIPKSVLQELLELLLAHARTARRDQHGRSLRAARENPGDSGRPRTGNRRPVSRLATADPGARTGANPSNESARIPTPVLEGGRAAARRGSAARRPPHRRRSAVPVSDPLRGSRQLPHDRLVAARRDRVDCRRGCGRRRAPDAPAQVQDLRAAGAGRYRFAPRDLVQPAISRTTCSGLTSG